MTPLAVVSPVKQGPVNSVRLGLTSLPSKTLVRYFSRSVVLSRNIFRSSSGHQCCAEYQLFSPSCGVQATHVHLTGQINELQHRDVTEEDCHCDGALYGPCHKITNVSHLLCANHESQGFDDGTIQRVMSPLRCCSCRGRPVQRVACQAESVAATWCSSAV